VGVGERANGATAPDGRVEGTPKLICQTTSSLIFESSFFQLWVSNLIIRPRSQKKKPRYATDC
jgi:hypothetical protein